MSKTFSSPLRFEPIFKEKIWGGGALREKLGKNAPDGVPVGESWEISGWGGSQTVVSGGEYAGATLGELFSRDPEGFAGTRAGNQKSFPLLFKFIDAKENLSIQIHPNKKQAQAHGWGERGKTEAWYVVDAVDGAQIALGFNRSDVTPEEAAAAVKEGNFETLLNFVPAKRGDTFFIPAGTVHAILGGVLVYEIQEESNATLRLYDWNRKRPDGSLRELHIGDALDIINFTENRPLKPESLPIEKNEVFLYESLCDNSKFILSRYKFLQTGSAPLNTIDGFRVISVTEGNAAIRAKTSENDIFLKKGQTILIPSRLDGFRIEGDAGAEALMTM